MIEPVPHQAIYRRWRAQTFGQIVGQEAVVETLRNAVRTGRVAHAILFVGPRGTGKTSLARILAKAINCTNLQDGDPCDACPSCVAIREGRAMDLIEIDAASNRGIDAIRDLRDRINYAPTDLRRKVYILDEAHQITRDAWNALLKSLEEPPEFVVFMFASTHPQEFPPAILSRLQRFDVRRLTTTEIESKLRRILETDGREATPEALHLIARLAAGGMRDAESMLDQLLASAAERLDEARVRDLLGLADGETIGGFVDALATGDVVAGMAVLDALEDRGRDLRGFLDQVIESLRETIVGAGRQPALARHPLATLVAVARRLAAIDPSRSGVGGLRLQLELALFAEPAAGAAAPAPVLAPVAREAPSLAARAEAPSEAPSDAPPEAASQAPATKAVRRIKPGAASAPEPAPGTAGSAPDPDAPSPVAVGPGSPSLAEPEVAGDLATLRDRWPEIVARVSAHPPTKPLIVACRPVSVEDGIVTLGFPEDQGFLRAVADRRKSVLEEGIGAVLGRPVAVRCIATNLDLVPEVSTDPDAEYLLREARRIFGADATDAAEVG
ncbi:MAG TPA: DNA polymerase III subunit gamma/tau [Candidatus Limnocylindrales bacterium]|nr:DNA polymerase III subunit gamma/tau [Candidatus Limnocylindrales bacterium]